MNEGDTIGARFSRALATRGFAYVQRGDDRWYVFEGSLASAGESHPVRLEVDPNGKELPRIYLTPVPNALRPIAPHVFGSGSLCYAAAGTVTLDVFDLVGQVLACIDRAETVLGQILRGEMTEDLGEEFFACWPCDAVCLLDFEEHGNLPLSALVLQSKDETRPVTAVTDDTVRTTKTLTACGFTLDTTRRITVRRIRTNVAPRALQDKWPPRTVADVLQWQSALDPRARKKLEEAIHAQAKTNANGLLCVIESPRFIYAFGVAYDRTAAAIATRTSTPLEVAYRSGVVPMYCMRIDDKYIADRNTPGRRTLAGKRVVLVGCGTIGGYLAEQLIKAGAGTRGGELRLVDSDILLPQNVGRHRLGLNSILRNKAVALAEELTRVATSATLNPLPADALDIDLSSADLIIDATGEEALGHLLARKLTGAAFRPTLSVWVEGPGTAVRALLRDSAEAACVRCLKTLHRKPIYEVVEGKIPQVFAGQGCESLYVPFPATASTQAACLAADMAVDWVNGESGPRLRTRLLDVRRELACGQVDPARLPGCPACNA